MTNKKSEEKFTIIIDGPGGAGKTTLAQTVIQNGVFDPHEALIIEGGNLFRAVAADAVANGVSWDDAFFPDYVVELMQNINFFAISDSDLRSAPVNKMLPHITALPKIREVCTERFSDIIKSAPQDVVFALARSAGHYNDADVKLYLDADFNICGTRREVEIKENSGDFSTARST